MATHSFEQIEEAVEKIAKCAKKLGVFELAAQQIHEG